MKRERGKVADLEAELRREKLKNAQGAEFFYKMKALKVRKKFRDLIKMSG